MASISKDELEPEDTWERLADGGFGAVFHVFWKTQKKHVAVKNLFKTDNFKEIEILKELQHPNIVTLYGFVHNAQNLMIVMELCELGSLRSFLDERQENPLELPLIFDWMIQASLPIDYLRHHRIEHMDIKTDNYVITSSMILKLTDFGLSRVLEKTKSCSSQAGSWRWMPPERFSDNKLSTTFHIYALALVFWCLFTRSMPYAEYVTEYSIANAVAEKKIRPAIPSCCPKPISELIESCWHHDRSKRPEINAVISTVFLHKSVFFVPTATLTTGSQTDLSGEKASFNETHADQVNRLQDKLNKKEDDMKTMEDRYKKFLEEVKAVIRTQDPKHNPSKSAEHAQPEIHEKQRNVEHAETWLHGNVIFSWHFLVVFLAVTVAMASSLVIWYSFPIPHAVQILKDEALEQRWELTGQFNTREFNGIHGLAITQDDDIAVASCEKGVKVFSRDGQVRKTLYNSGGSTSVCVTPDNRFAFNKRNREEINFSDYQGNYLNIYTVLIKNVNNISSKVNSIAVDPSGKIVVGQVLNTISTHHADGSPISKFATQSRPYRLAVTSNGEIVSSFMDAEMKRGESVQLVDYSGNNLRVIQPPPEVTVWKPGFVCCGQGEIFVSNAGLGKPNGVYRFTSEGDYLGCVTTEVRNPSGIALSRDGMELFVADYGNDHVKVYKRP